MSVLNKIVFLIYFQNYFYGKNNGKYIFVL